MSRKPTVSPSKITTYLACPVRYRFTYVEPKFRVFMRSKPYYSFGISLHMALQRFHDSNDAGVTTTDEALASLEEHWLTSGYSSPEEAAEALAEGRELIIRYVESAQIETGAEVLFVERQLTKDLGDFELVGKIDRADQHEDGTIDIIDYKTGGKFSEPELRHDIAMNCYALLMRELYPNNAIQLTIVNLRGKERVSIRVEETELKQFEQDLMILGTEILNREYHEIEPQPKRICSTCDFLSLCKKHEEFREQFTSKLKDTQEVW